MIDLKILRQQVELGASPARIVDLVEQMLADEMRDVWVKCKKRDENIQGIVSAKCDCVTYCQDIGGNRCRYETAPSLPPKCLADEIREVDRQLLRAAAAKEEGPSHD